ncbi:hypothetical protein S96127_1887 [Yersinia pestis]|nr:hypothetical protein S96127_1887 [Yersinia pestis]
MPNFSLLKSFFPIMLSKSFIDFATGGVVLFITLAALLSEPFSTTAIKASNFRDRNIIHQSFVSKVHQKKPQVIKTSML